ncbi:MAG: sigma-70 family RNA polymerase sigma factor [Bacteroidetes bacterium]|nr:sigma-70 family RNA polymerase sigma factor [Bacteroidota bacterium]
MAVYTDTELLDLIAGSDSAAFSYLYKAHFNMIRNLVEKNSGTYDDASDIFQETLIIIFEKVRDKKLHISCSLKTFIYSVARNQWLKKLNASRKNVQLKNFEDFIRVEESESEFSQDIDIKNLFAEIGEACRKLLILFYYRKRSMEEISLELNYSNADTAKNQKYKCIQRLKKLVVEKR